MLLSFFFFHSIYYLIFSSVLQVKFQYRNVFNSRFGTAGGAKFERRAKRKNVLVWRWKKTFDLPETLTNVYNNMGLVISSLTGVKCAVAGCP